MPLFDFHCPQCDKTSELIVRFSDKPLCPECGAADMVRLLSGTAPPGKSAGIAKACRAEAARQGHLSNFR